MHNRCNGGHLQINELSKQLGYNKQNIRKPKSSIQSSQVFILLFENILKLLICLMSLGKTLNHLGPKYTKNSYNNPRSYK